MCAAGSDFRRGFMKDLQKQKYDCLTAGDSQSHERSMLVILTAQAMRTWDKDINVDLYHKT